MTPFQQNSRLRKSLKRGALLLSVAGSLSFFSSCGGNVEYVDEEVLTPTKGVITEIEEVSADRFLISDETAVPNKEDSRIIAAYLDGTKDTLTLDEAKLVSASDTSSTGRRHRGVSRIAMYGLMGYFMGRNMSTPTSASAYKNASVHNRVTRQAGGTLRSTASRSVVRRPASNKSGFGKGKSTRSFGG